MSQLEQALKKVAQACPQCSQEVEGFVIPDGRFICPKCAHPAVVARWQREWAPLEKAQRKQQEQGRREGYSSGAHLQAQEQREATGRGATLVRRAPGRAPPRSSAAFQAGMLCALLALLACFGFVWRKNSGLEEKLAVLSDRQAELETGLKAKYEQLVEQNRELLGKLTQLQAETARAAGGTSAPGPATPAP